MTEWQTSNAGASTSVTPSAAAPSKTLTWLEGGHKAIEVARERRTAAPTFGEFAVAIWLWGVDLVR